MTGLAGPPRASAGYRPAPAPAGIAPGPAVRWLAPAALAGTGLSLALLAALAAAGPSTLVATFRPAPPWPPWFWSAQLSPAVAATAVWLAAALGTAGLTAGLAAVRRGWRPRPRRLVSCAAVAACALLVVPPLGSADMLDYAISGRIVVLGHSPYVMTPGQLRAARDPVAAVAVPGYQDQPSRYGPAATLAEGAASELAGDSTARTIFWLKAWNGLAFLALVLALDRRLRGDPARRARAHLLWSVNPVVLWWALAAGHNDVLALAAGATALLAVRPAELGRAALGRAAVGRAAVGRAALGRAAVGRAAVGRAALGRAAVGRAAVGRAAVGRAALGRAAVGRAAVGRAALGRAAVGRAAVGRAALGRAAVGRAAVGRAALGRAAVGRAALGRAALAGLLLGLAAAVKAPFALFGAGLLGAWLAGAWPARAGAPGAGAAETGAAGAGTAGTRAAGAAGAGAAGAGTAGTRAASAGRRSRGALAALALGAAAVLIPAYLLAGRPALAATLGQAGSPPSGYLPWYAAIRVLHLPDVTGVVTVLGLAGVAALAVLLLRRLPPGAPDVPAARAAFAVTLAWLVVSPQQRPWYDVMIFPLLAVLPATRLDWIVVIRAVAGVAATLPRLHSPADLHLAWLSAVTRAAFAGAVPITLTAAGCALLWVCGTARWRSASGPPGPGTGRPAR